MQKGGGFSCYLPLLFILLGVSEAADFGYECLLAFQVDASGRCSKCRLTSLGRYPGLHELPAACCSLPKKIPKERISVAEISCRC